jgi:hypothetical protein
VAILGYNTLYFCLMKNVSRHDREKKEKERDNGAVLVEKGL